MHFTSILRTAGASLYEISERLNLENMRRQVGLAESPVNVIDLGCGDGTATKAVTADLRSATIRAVENHGPSRAVALERNIDAIDSDLDGTLPFGDDCADVIISNQVIEHLADTDNFLEEMHRILRPGGLAVVSTENIASWHNIGALVLGFQPFSSSNYSLRRYPLGNPLSLHHGQRVAVVAPGMLHRRMFSSRALKELFTAHGFKVLDVRGSGYHPWPPQLGRLDVAHAHFISVAARK